MQQLLDERYNFINDVNRVITTFSLEYSCFFGAFCRHLSSLFNRNYTLGFVY